MGPTVCVLASSVCLRVCLKQGFRAGKDALDLDNDAGADADADDNDDVDVDVDVDIDIVNVYFDGPLKTWIESLHLQL